MAGTHRATRRRLEPPEDAELIKEAIRDLNNVKHIKLKPPVKTILQLVNEVLDRSQEEQRTRKSAGVQQHGRAEYVQQVFLDLGIGELHISLYLGKEWEQGINDLNNVQPATIPGLRFKPHPWQSKGAAQGHYACHHTDFKVFYCGDDMGLGKTKLAIMMIKLAEDIPGFTLVVAPKAVNQQWLDEAETAFTKEHSLKAMILSDSRTTAHQLFAMRPDMVILSYEFVENLYREIYAEKWDPNALYRPTSAVHSGFWAAIKWPIKYLILDEAHRIGNMKTARFRATKAIPAKSTALFSGTFAHNRWDGWAGAVAFGKAHPFKDRWAFNRAFATFDFDNRVAREPHFSRLKLLQRFLMRFTIARPSIVLNLPGILHFRVCFDLSEGDQSEVQSLFEGYMYAQKKAKEEREKQRKLKKGKGRIEVVRGGKEQDQKILQLAIDAQLISLHPIMLDDRFRTRSEDRNANMEEHAWKKARVGTIDAEDSDADSDYIDDLDEDDDDDDDEYRPGQENINAVWSQMEILDSPSPSAVRKVWLSHLDANIKLPFNSERVLKVLATFEKLRTKYPDRKICVASQYVKFLDILEVAFRI